VTNRPPNRVNSSWWSSSQNAYAAGAVGFADLIDSERMLISVRRIVAQAQIERDKRLAELEALAGVDIETLGRPQSASATRPASLAVR
jgi:outer membrane protein TolC